MVLLLFGPPGSGKGTQSRFITNWLHIPAISTGELLRGEIEAESALGRQARAIISEGKLVSDGLVNQILADRIAQPDCRDGFLLDGYPRTVEQAEYLDQLLASRGLPEPVILHLEVPAAALIARMLSRRQCPTCGRTYNLLTDPPKKSGVCDDDGTPLTQRLDDNIEVFKQRLQTYDDVTRPVLAHYYNRNYHQIAGDRSPKYIFEAITEILEPMIAPPSEP